jgi:hypothetical protein
MKPFYEHRVYVVRVNGIPVTSLLARDCAHAAELARYALTLPPVESLTCEVLPST